jgi:hypothetical protein
MPISLLLIPGRNGWCCVLSTPFAHRPEISAHTFCSPFYLFGTTLTIAGLRKQRNRCTPAKTRTTAAAPVAVSKAAFLILPFNARSVEI